MGQRFQLLSQLVDFLSLLADDHAHPRGVDVDDHFLSRPLNPDAGDAGPPVTAFDVIADPLIFHQQLGEILLAGVPLALPIDHDPGAKTGGPHFLTHAIQSPPAYPTASSAREHSGV